MRSACAMQLACFKEDEDESMRHLQTAVALHPKDSRVLYNAACTYGVLGKKAEALETLKRSFAAGYSNPAWAANDTDLDCLHDDPEFQKLVAHDEKPTS
jgi:predicted Zn-dependent protease